MGEIRYAKRDCDICGSGSHTEIVAYAAKARTHGGVYKWQVRDVVCRQCGFAFVSPAPTEQSLTDYYTDSFAFWRGEKVEFSIEHRLKFLRRHLDDFPKGTFVEIGPNATQGFEAALTSLTKKYVAVEPNADYRSERQALGSLLPGTVDVIAAYFVLEHVLDPGRYLVAFSRALKTGGLLIVEVPNLCLYGDNPAGIIHFEHVTHFSPNSLAVLAARAGLKLLEASEVECSRPYGFVAAFRKSDAPIEVPDLDEFQTAHRCMVAGAGLMARYWAQFDNVRRRIIEVAAVGGTIVFWPANKPCSDLLDGFSPPETCVFVDSDPARSKYLEPVHVVVPDRAANAISRAELFVIGSELHSTEILHEIAQRRGNALLDHQYIVLSPGFVIGHGPAKI